MNKKVEDGLQILSKETNFPIEKLSDAYNRIVKSQTMDSYDIQYWHDIGVPIVMTLGKVLNKSHYDIMKMVSNGEINISNLDQSIIHLTCEGGLFGLKQ
ncbi:hypothetical protein FY557_17540 [Chryseobacterium sp. SN22]|uniref:hypothetical protein n=1 Tax=Chryseobacterium sp. SN22 TaxID=2606431 RepID=UPI0011EF4966|nr:hypothetical protein [Chryseobacterium sp. SN22]KAA0126453.1 hypothetical protein FY557_17540 [Chryseobacterium sp. SN22]